MKTVSATDAKQRFAALLDAAQREPVVIRRQNRDVAVVISPERYERMRRNDVEELQRFCDRIGRQAAERGIAAPVVDRGQFMLGREPYDQLAMDG